eukprot:CAMPEP_0201475056 /NCGR_PEP_ID=MMETSP0151_2-20130828/546_1 /ASSEMBLY_ACC=CAM_ASM_000257 /TAXON_ID=200890 /ORGANISM="Paramoeba atlantica, Strain 621/1 / CCAP 1560/9" /LENGTH=98 /DNA_ID=CAMNT_0047855061 /DNA_START=56 /DNA_END=352 /DNA_ORIENTATION=+
MSLPDLDCGGQCLYCEADHPSVTCPRRENDKRVETDQEKMKGFLLNLEARNQFPWSVGMEIGEEDIEVYDPKSKQNVRLFETFGKKDRPLVLNFGSMS